MAVILILAAGAAAWLSWFTGADPITTATWRGTALPSPNQWLPVHSTATLLINALVLLSCGATMIWINGWFSILRSFSVTFVGLFLVMTAATPGVATVFQGGSLLAMTMMLAMLLMYSVYNTPKRGSRRIFLAFFLIAGGALMQYGFAVYIPVFLIGIGQMRALKFRTLAAAALGVITPLWLWWAFAPGLPSLHIPQLDNPFAPLTLMERIRFFATVGLTLFAGLIMGSYNLLKIYSYNAKARALNGLLTVMSVTTGIAALADWSNMPFYVPLLNVCVAFQAGHFFHITINHRTGYVTMLTLIALYAALWVWSIMA